MMSPKLAPYAGWERSADGGAATRRRVARPRQESAERQDCDPDRHKPEDCEDPDERRACPRQVESHGTPRAADGVEKPEHGDGSEERDKGDPGAVDGDERGGALTGAAVGRAVDRHGGREHE